MNGLSHTEENYIKAIFHIQNEQEGEDKAKEDEIKKSLGL